MSGPFIPAPDDRAPHADWMAFAVAQGMPEEQARGLTRDQLRVCLLPPGAPLGAEPLLDRHEQDPEIAAGRRDARRKPWERP